MKIPKEILDKYNVMEDLGIKEEDIIYIPTIIATKEQPDFMRITGSKRYGDNHEILFNNTLCAMTGIRHIQEEIYKNVFEDADFYVLRAMEGDDKGKRFLLKEEEFIINDQCYVDKDGKYTDKEQYEKYLKEYKDILKDIHIKIHVEIFPEVFDDIRESVANYRIPYTPMMQADFYPEDIHSVDETEVWMIENHPEGALTYSATSNIGEFRFLSVPHPSVWSNDDRWATWSGRESLVRERAEELGCKVGKFSYECYEPTEDIRKEIEAEETEEEEDYEK